MFRDMRRKDRQLSREAAEDMLREATHAVVALHGDDGYPYAVPVNHAYADGKIYFHGAPDGHKSDAIDRDAKASLCVVVRDEVVPEKFSTRFRSAIAFGSIRALRDDAEIRKAMDAVLARFSPAHMDAGRKYVDSAAPKLRVWEMTVEHLTAKGV